MFKHLSSSLLLAIITLMGVGLVQVYSASYVFATESYNDGLYFFKRQFVYVALSLILMVATTLMPMRWIEKWGWTSWIFASLAVLLTFVPGFGVRVGGAIRWLQMPMGVRFEPSEILKLSFSLMFAAILVKKENLIGKMNNSAILFILILPLLLLLKQPDFGSFAIIVIVAGALLFSFGLKWRYIVVSFLVAMPTFYYLVMSKDYRRARIMTFLDPWADPEQKGFQVIQSLLSFSSGGMTGVGLGQGQGKLFFLPEAHTDFTMAVMGEEVGFIGFLMVMSLYGFVILRGLQIAVKCENKFSRATAIGISVTFALSVFINVGVVIGLLPTKGLTLPFLSYGGSSLVALSMMFGVLLNIEKNLKFENNSHQFPFHQAKPSLKF